MGRLSHLFACPLRATATNHLPQVLRQTPQVASAHRGAVPADAPGPAVVTVATAGDQQTVPLTGSAAVYGRQPSGAVGYPSAPPGGWTLTVAAGSLGPPAEWADDLILIVDYQSDLAAR